MTRRMTWQEARDFYDRLGARQALESRFQRRAFDRLVSVSRFESARSVFELGCGTGRLARRLLAELLPEDARYVGVDVSGRMVELTRARLAPWSDRAAVVQTQGELQFDHPAGSFDRFVATYVLDLLPEDSIAAVLEEAWRLLQPDGLLCVLSLTVGESWLSRTLSGAWSALSGKFPARLGGCRRIRPEEFLASGHWHVENIETVSVFGVPSALLVARHVQESE